MTSLKRIEKGQYWDRALSLVEGCTPVSPACAYCWSAQATHMRAKQKNPKIRARYGGLTEKRDGIPVFNGRIRLMEADIEKPLHTKKPTTWAIWNDLFHEDVPFDFIDQVFYIIQEEATQHLYLILTKKPDRMLEYYNYALYESTDATGNLETATFEIKDNVFLGTTVEHSAHISRIIDLLEIPARHFLSIEPMLGPVDLVNISTKEPGAYYDALRGRYWNTSTGYENSGYGALELVVLGGESGPHARPMHPDWPRRIRDDCLAAGVPFFFKQWGAQLPGRHLDDRTWDELPWN